MQILNQDCVFKITSCSFICVIILLHYFDSQAFSIYQYLPCRSRDNQVGRQRHESRCRCPQLTSDGDYFVESHYDVIEKLGDSHFLLTEDGESDCIFRCNSTCIQLQYNCNTLYKTCRDTNSDEHHSWFSTSVTVHTMAVMHFALFMISQLTSSYMY